MFNTRPSLSISALRKDLFVTDPPCTKASVSLEFSIGPIHSFRGGSIRVDRTVEHVEGLKMKHLMEDPMEMAGEVQWSLKGQRGSKDV